MKRPIEGLDLKLLEILRLSKYYMNVLLLEVYEQSKAPLSTQRLDVPLSDYTKVLSSRTNRLLVLDRC